ncbi:MAG: YajD family HNH nuclease [Pseudomonadota bacterium]
MTDRPPPPDARKAQIVAAARRSSTEREGTYRDRALKLFPHICARCQREFEGKRLRELTVHHKDHNHDYNPPDGSNWELLCLYCHDEEHERFKTAVAYGPGGARETTAPSGGNLAFADLAKLLEGKK